MGRVNGNSKKSGFSSGLEAGLQAPSVPPTLSAKSSSSGMDALCDVAAAAGGPRNEALAQQPKPLVQVEAFASIHDMIHAAILQHGTHASLQQIYQACQERGRIAYKRASGSRLITHNNNWKNQIRHALYTSSKFARTSNQDNGSWKVADGQLSPRPSVVMVPIPADEVGASGSVVGEASDVAVQGDLEGVASGVHSTPGGGRSGHGGRSLRTRGCASPEWKTAQDLSNCAPRSTRSKRARTPSKRLLNFTSGTMTPELVSRAESKDDVQPIYDEESESVAGQSQYADPSGGAEMHKPPACWVRGDRRLAAASELKGPITRRTKNQLVRVTANLRGGEEEEIEGGAETAGDEAFHGGHSIPLGADEIASNCAARAVPAELCSSHTVHNPTDQALTDTKQPMLMLSDRSAEADASSPSTKHEPMEVSASHDAVPLKKRFKAAAAKAASDAAAAEEQADLDALPGTASKRDPSRNRRKPLRSQGLTNLDSSMLAATPESSAQASGARKRRQSLPTPGVTLRPRMPATPQVTTPALSEPAAVTNPTPTTQPEPPTGITTRTGRRCAHQTPEQKPVAASVKEAVLAVLREAEEPLTAQELTGRVQRSGARPPQGKITVHDVAEAVYDDLRESNGCSEFWREEDGKFGLREWRQPE